MVRKTVALQRDLLLPCRGPCRQAQGLKSAISAYGAIDRYHSPLLVGRLKIVI